MSAILPEGDKGSAPRKLRLAFAISCVVFLVALAISPVKDLLMEWKHYKRLYASFADTRQERKQLLSDVQPGVEQIWIPQLKVVDRCPTCHLGYNQPSLRDASVPAVFRTHPDMPHLPQQWGCVVCHRGQGRATETKEAHETTLSWEQPMLPVRFIQASCGTCHHDKLAQAPQLVRGRELLTELNCAGCHRLQDIKRKKMIGPDLSSVGYKVSRRWIYKWLKEPRTVTDQDGNVTVNGVETEETPRMPKFRLSEEDLRALSAYLSTQKKKAPSDTKIDARVVAAWQKRPEAADQGETLFRQMFCTTCHSLATTRAGQTVMIGGDIGPELTKVGSKVSPEWLVAWLRNPQAYLPNSGMPRYGWTDENLYKVTRYIETRLTDSSLYDGIPELGAATDAEVQTGKRLFLSKGCASCHAIDGVPQPSDFGPDLTAVGAKTISQLEFGQAQVPHTLVSYIQAKLTDPVSVNSAARMPQYHLDPASLDAITTALLSMTGEPASPAWTNLQVPANKPEFHPAGEFGQVYERYKCFQCHQFNGYGGTLAPELSFEGSRAKRSWLVSFLKNPQTLRPALTLRMPQFNMTDREIASVADYFETALQSPQVPPGSADPRAYTPEMAKTGKELYEVKYQCQSCHTIGSTGGYVGPSLNNAGNWLKPEWIEAWLRNPQSLVPGAIEPRQAFTEREIKAITAYLLTLRQEPGRGKANGGKP